MEEIKVGEYVRTPEQGFIGKLVEINNDVLNYYKIDVKKVIRRTNGMSDNYIYSRDGFGLKHSFNIIDILKIGDFIHTDYGWGWYHHKVDENTIVIDDGDEFIDVNKDEIHRILTQEMLWKNSYELKE